MAQLALTFAQRAATTVAQGFAARAISSLLTKRRDTGARLEELHVLSSTDGAPMPIPYGRVRLGGQVIWTDQPVEHEINSRAGGKGGPRITERKYTLSFAIGLCEGEIDGIGRIWADGALLDNSLGSLRIYTGAEDQLPDPLIETTQNSDNTPAFRGLAYVVFEDFSLEEYGNRIPQLSFEVFRSPKGLGSENFEEKIQGISLIPGSGEFIYAAEPVITNLGPGRSGTENVHGFRGRTDVEVALDDLQTHLPNCDTVSLVVSWFGDDLRCGITTLQPAAEDTSKLTEPLEWQVQGLNRSQTRLVSRDAQDRPVFGGTPDDVSVLQSIASLKFRNLEIVFYPFILMDIPTGNALPDPYGGTEQSAFPWRGRITCFPAPGQLGTVDKTNAVIAQIDQFFGTTSASDFSSVGQTISYNGPNEWSYRRFILHYAHLCALAGGVDAFIIGSELRALTSLRDAAGSFPAVQHLQQLAAQVRTILPATQISYSADWSEYFGYHPQDGSNDVLFNLDSLWADPNVDFIGIDWYVPLSDWRDGNQHIDASTYRSIYEEAYLTANVEGGEGYDWFYASLQDRQNQQRTSITDGSYNKNWVFRYKDLRSWWSNEHFDRIGGVEVGAATAWVPESKPIWFTETGCPAVDKGANQPNVFFDAKSSESTFPYFSRGRRDDLIQREYLNAIISYWALGAGNNPVSSVYGAPMIDDDKILAWTWDARPFPQFPALEDVWSDGPNWEKGHWLNGRMGLSSLAALIQDVCFRAGFVNVDVSRVEGLVSGYVVTGPTDARAALESILTVYGVELFETFDGLRFQNFGQDSNVLSIAVGGLVDTKDLAPKLGFPDSESLPIEARIQFTDEGADYQPASASAHGVKAQKRRTIDMALPLVADRAFISDAARDMLARAIASAHSANITLPPSFLVIEPGDAIRVDTLDVNRVWRVERTEDSLIRELSLRADSPASVSTSAGAKPGIGRTPLANPGPPALAIMDLPLLPGEDERNGPLVAAFAEPWTGDVLLVDGVSLTPRARVLTPAIMGEVTASIGPGDVLGRWDYGTSLIVEVYEGVLSSSSEMAVLAGANTLAVEHDGGLWEVLQFQNAVLTGANTYVLTGLLRGIAGSDDALALPIGQNARCVLLNGASQVLPMQDYEIGVPVAINARSVAAPSGGLEETTFSVTFNNRIARLPSPVHLKTHVNATGVDMLWIRRARTGGDFWGAADISLVASPETYRVRIYSNGAVIMEETAFLPKVTLTDAEIDVLFPSGRPETMDVGVAQVSSLSGTGIEVRRFLSI